MKKRIIQEGLISEQILLFFFRHHVYVKAGNTVELAEVGPRFEMRGSYISGYTNVYSDDIFFGENVNI